MENFFFFFCMAMTGGAVLLGWYYLSHGATGYRVVFVVLSVVVALLYGLLSYLFRPGNKAKVKEA